MMSYAQRYNAQLGLRMDWVRKLRGVFGLPADGGWGELTEQVRIFQRELGAASGAHGLICAKTRCDLEERYPELSEPLLGPYLGARRLCFLREGALYEAARSIVESASAEFWDFEMQPQILALRGARLCGDEILCDGSACEAQKSLDAGRVSDYFSSEGKAFGDCMVLMWREGRARAIAYPASVSPNILWPEGTAHLRDGQYVYRLGYHRTNEAVHKAAVLEFCANASHSGLIVQNDAYGLQYRALNAASEIEVIRSATPYLGLSQSDWERARLAIASRDPRFTSSCGIRINIHSCPGGQSSSQGCQNIPVPYYGDFMQRLESILCQHPLRTQALIPYTLLDATKARV